MNLIKTCAAVVCLCSLSVGNLKSQTTILTIDRQAVQQTMHSFGASDAWRAQFVGKNWPLAKREAIADLFFSKEFDKKGNPKGIGLSLWRFNIGAGSVEQGDSSQIVQEWRRTECFLDKNGNYNWNKQEGQRWFLEAARKRGVEKTLGFLNSAPQFFTKNGLAKATKDVYINLQPDKYNDFARFIVEVCNQLKFDYISPINEPQWDWTGNSQEGSPATNEEASILIHNINNELQKSKSNCKIAFGEAGDIQYLFKQNTIKPQRDNQIEEVFSKDGSFSISHLPTVQKSVLGHSYWSVWDVNNLIAQRKALHEKMLHVPGFDYWQSEYCIMEKNDDIGGGPGRDLTINTALYVARIIHFDLTITNAASWQWWTALSEGDYKDGLIYLDPTEADRNTSNACKNDGEFHTSKLFWALGNYSLFVRPGMKRLQVSRNDNLQEVDEAKGLMTSAYFDEAKNKLVVVMVNYSNNNKPVSVNPVNFSSNKSKKFKVYETSQASDLYCKGFVKGKYNVPARSIVTFVEE